MLAQRFHVLLHIIATGDRKIRLLITNFGRYCYNSFLIAPLIFPIAMATHREVACDKEDVCRNRFNNLWFLWKPTYFRLGTISENVCIGDFYQCARFHACIKKCTIHLKFGAKLPEYILFC